MGAEETALQHGQSGIAIKALEVAPGVVMVAGAEVEVAWVDGAVGVVVVVVEGSVEEIGIAPIDLRAGCIVVEGEEGQCRSNISVRCSCPGDRTSYGLEPQNMLKRDRGGGQETVHPFV
jgi:hypothetical protein